jgi:hypothetical protein
VKCFSVECCCSPERSLLCKFLLMLLLLVLLIRVQYFQNFSSCRTNNTTTFLLQRSVGKEMIAFYAGYHKDVERDSNVHAGGQRKKGKPTCLVVHHAVETCGGVEVQLSAFFSSALDGGDWSASRPGQSNPGRRAVCSHWVGYREMGPPPTISLDTSENRKIACPYRESNHDSSVIHPVLIVQIFTGCVKAGGIYSNRCDLRLFLFYWHCNQI